MVISTRLYYRLTVGKEMNSSKLDSNKPVLGYYLFVSADEAI